MAKVCPTRRGGVPAGRPSQAEQMLGAAGSGRRVWKSSWVGGACPTGQGVQKEQQHLGLTRVRCFQDHKELLPTHTRATPGLSGPHSPTAESGPNRAGGPGPAKAGHSPVIRHHDGVERVLILGHCGRPTRLCPRDAPPGVAAAKPAAARFRQTSRFRGGEAHFRRLLRGAGRVRTARERVQKGWTRGRNACAGAELGGAGRGRSPASRSAPQAPSKGRSIPARRVHLAASGGRDPCFHFYKTEQMEPNCQKRLRKNRGRNWKSYQRTNASGGWGPASFARGIWKVREGQFRV